LGDVETLSDIETAAALQAVKKLDPGEAYAIALALQIKLASIL
jgi:predicted nucleic acid-binding protein